MVPQKTPIVQTAMVAIFIVSVTQPAAAQAQSSPFLPWETATEHGAVSLLEGASSKDPSHLRLAVIPFAARDGSPCEAGQALADDLTRTLAQQRSANVDTIVDREAMAHIEREQKLAHSDLADPGTAAKLGKLSGATAIVTGSIGALPGGYGVSLKMVSVETGAILSATSMRVDGDDVAARGGCGVPTPMVGARPTDDRVYGRQTFTHKLFLYASVTGFVAGLAAGTVAIIGLVNVAKHCDRNDLCDQTGADAARYGRVAAVVADGGLALGVVALGIHFLIPPASPTTTGLRVFPLEGGIVGGRF